MLYQKKKSIFAGRNKNYLANRSMEIQQKNMTLIDYINQIDILNSWLTDYKKEVPQFIQEAQQGFPNWKQWDSAIFNRYFEAQTNSVANLGQGVMWPDDKQNIKDNWTIIAPRLKDIANNQNTPDFDLYRRTETALSKLLVKRNSYSAYHRMIAGLQPKFLCTIVDDRKLDYLINNIKKYCSDSDVVDLTGNHYEKSYKLVQYINSVYPPKGPMDNATIPWQLYDLFYNLNNHQNNQGTQQSITTNMFNILKENHNLILTGAPGTGKTYTAKQLAIQMCAGDLYKIEEEWERLLKEGRVGFVQFHPSYDYTDFVEGLRPIKGNTEGKIGFERKDGIFKEFCKGALKNNISGGIDDFERCWQALINDIDTNDYVRIPLLSGKKEILIELNEYGTGLCNRTYENGQYEKGKWISGASKFFSKEQLYNIYKGLPGVPQGGHDNYRKAIVQYMEQQYNMQKYALGNAIDNNKQSYVFIIDEINRGELSKIFGELFFSIDPGYRGKEGIIKTQYQNLVEEDDEFADGFYIPKNVYIIGTMNDIDRGVESMDFAIRRRFAWKEVTAEELESIIDSANVDDSIKLQAKNRMHNLNNAIQKIDGLGEAFCLGGAYFKKIEQYDGNFEQLWKNHIEGLLKEYLRGTSNLNEQVGKLKTAYDNTTAPA